VSTLDLQVRRSLDNYRRKPDDIEKYIFLQGLLNRNEVLFYGSCSRTSRKWFRSSTRRRSARPAWS